jgi:hypothetical protein
MKSVCFISQAESWRRLNGGMQRDLKLLNFLAQNFALKFVYLGILDDNDVSSIAQLSPNFEIYAIGTGKEKSGRDWISRFRRQRPEVRDADVYIVRGAETSFMLDALPEGSKTFLDTLDLVSERRQGEGSADRSLAFLTREQEIEIFSRFTHVICIQDDEAELASQWIGGDKVVTAKHPVEATTELPRGNRNRIGLVASNWPPNAYGLRDFVINCWPNIRQAGATLDVYGNVIKALNVSLPAVTFHGYVDDLNDCYASLGLAINPVQYGAGLKIKSIEAMARGLPLVTSREGASGIEHLDGEALLIVDTWDDFTAQIIALMKDEERCLALASNAVTHVSEHFSEEACFSGLRDRIANCT